MLYIDISNPFNKILYYNIEAEINEHLIKELGVDYSKLPHLQNKFPTINLPKQGSSINGRIVEWDVTKQERVDIDYALNMAGILANVQSRIAQDVIDLAKYYCPVDTGYLRNSIGIGNVSGNMTEIIVDCPYAWYVEEFTWRQHDPPTCAKFLERAVFEVSRKYGII